MVAKIGFWNGATTCWVNFREELLLEIERKDGENESFLTCIIFLTKSQDSSKPKNTNRYKSRSSRKKIWVNSNRRNKSIRSLSIPFENNRKHLVFCFFSHWNRKRPISWNGLISEKLSIETLPENTL